MTVTEELTGIEYRRKMKINFLSSCKKYVQLLEEQSDKHEWQVRIIFFNNDVIHTVKSIQRILKNMKVLECLTYLSDLNIENF